VILDVALSPSALSDISEASIGPMARTVQRALMEALYAHSRLWLATEFERAELPVLMTSSTLSQAERLLWREFIGRMLQDRRLTIYRPELASPLAGAATMADLSELTQHIRQVLAVIPHDTFSRVFGSIGNGEASITSGLTATVAEALAETKLIDDLRRLAARSAHANGSSREDVWAQLFAPLAGVARNITIFDRYLFESIYREKAGRGTFTDQLPWLLGHLDQDGSPETTVRLIGRADTYGHETAKDVFDRISDSWIRTERRVTRLEVFLVKWGALSGVWHDRHFRFGSVGVFGLPAGFDRLGSPVITSPEGFTWNYYWRTDLIAEFQSREDSALGEQHHTSHAANC
jgi:hypothetical protein